MILWGAIGERDTFFANSERTDPVRKRNICVKTGHDSKGRANFSGFAVAGLVQASEHVSRAGLEEPETDTRHHQDRKETSCCFLTGLRQPRGNIAINVSAIKKFKSYIVRE